MRAANISLTIRDGSLSDSDTNGGGGGILVTNFGFLTLSNSVVTDNQATNVHHSGGGGIEANNGSSLTISRSSIVHNSASSSGGGIV